MALGEPGMQVDAVEARNEFETAVDNSQPIMAMRYLTGVIDDLYTKIEALTSKDKAFDAPTEMKAEKPPKATKVKAAAKAE